MSHFVDHFCIRKEVTPVPLGEGLSLTVTIDNATVSQGQRLQKRAWSPGPLRAAQRRVPVPVGRAGFHQLAVEKVEGKHQFPHL